MKENLYRSMMEQIQLSDDADRRIRTALEQEVRRKRRHPLGRAGLAAAVAALLITTALGAQLLISAVLKQEGNAGQKRFQGSATYFLN